MREEYKSSSGQKKQNNSSPVTISVLGLSPVLTSGSFPLQRALGNQAMQAAAKPLFIQPKLKVGAPDDRFEQEADQRASALLGHRKMPPSESLAQSNLLRSPSKKNSGKPLPNSLLRQWSQRLNSDLSPVRIHPEDRSALRFGAKAYADGVNLHFAPGEYQPDRAEGQRLLAHEVAHVLQPADGVIRREPFVDTIVVIRSGNSRDLMRLYVAGENIRSVRGDSHLGVENGVYRCHPVRISRNSIRIYLVEGDEQNYIYATGDSARYFSETQTVTVRIVASENDLLRQRLDELPERLQDFLFSATGPAVRPEDVQTLLRIADAVSDLSDEELLEYRARVVGTTSDVNEFERGVTAWLAELRQRRAAITEEESAGNRLIGQEALYDLYLDWLRVTNGGGGFITTGIAPPSGQLADYEATAFSSLRVTEGLGWRQYYEFRRALDAAGYANIAAFEDALQRFLNGFRERAYYVALESMGRYEHFLTEQRTRYQSSEVLDALHMRLATAHRQVSEADSAGESALHAMPPAGAAVALPYVRSLQAEQAQKEAQARTSVAVATAETDPIASEHGFDPLELARQDRAHLGRFLTDFIDERLGNIRSTRENLDEEHDLVFQFDMLVRATEEQAGISNGTIWARAIADHSVPRDDPFLAIASAVIILALTFATAGTGLPAAIVAAGSFGLSAFFAEQAYEEYSVAHDAYGAGMMSNDPWFGWVVIAVVGAGLDLAAFGAALRASLPLRTALDTFEATGDAVALQRTLDRLTEIDQSLREAIVSGAEARAVEQARMEAVLAEWFPRGAARVSFFLGLDWLLAEGTARLAYSIYLTARRGITTFRQFLLAREAIALLGDVSRLSPAALARLEQAHASALQQVLQIATHGRTLGLNDAEIELFFRVWGRNPHLTPVQVQGAMDEWLAGATRSGRFREFPASLMDDETRRLLPDFDRRVAGTGAIENITARTLAGEEGGLSVTIEGAIRPGTLSRNPGPGQALAPSFNSALRSRLSRAGHSISQALRDLGLNPGDWQVLHLWGPSFGDEAAAGMMMGPRHVNIGLQSGSAFNSAAGRLEREGIEAFITDLARQAEREGGSVRLAANATAWPSPTPAGFRLPSGLPFLRRASYTIEVTLPGGRVGTLRVVIEVAEPPASSAVISLDGNVGQIGDLIGL